VADGEGWVSNLAVLREHRRAGLGRALLTTAFACYAAKGRRWAGLGVDPVNGAYRLYTSVGMVPTFEADVYERTVRSS
jgi:ribosomal protein S18 acetylase RimI-like enzyme